MMNRRTIIILTVTVACLAAAVAMAQGHGRGEGQGRGMRQGREGHFEMMVEHLDLTEAQQEAIETIREENQASNLALAKESSRLENELEGELLKDDPSEKVVLELNSKLGELRTEHKANGLKTRLAIRKQLTPEQRDKMLAFQGSRGRGGQNSCGGPGLHKGHGEGPGMHRGHASD
jgi:Spy/CpxP family protein refolding chaperone